MSPKDQRIAIAESLGWQKSSFFMHHPELNRFKLLPGSPAYEKRKAMGLDNDHCSLPDWLGDLNAMHEAEKMLDQGGRTRYIFHLQMLCGGRQFGENYFATAAQRAEAYLRTVGKWKEGDDNCQGPTLFDPSGGSASAQSKHAE